MDVSLGVDADRDDGPSGVRPLMLSLLLLKVAVEQCRAELADRTATGPLARLLSGLAARPALRRRRPSERPTVR